MSVFHDRQQSDRAIPGRAPGAAAFDAPGKRTLTHALTAGDAAAQGRAPIQRQSDQGSHPVPSGAFVGGGGPARLTQAKRGAGPDGAPVEEPGSGQPLPQRTQARMEDLFGTDLSRVRVHEGGAASSVGAVAYTQGSDLHFAPGRFQPGTHDGDRLIGHELAHVMQQREGRVALPTDGTSVVEHAGLEAEADRAGDRVAAGEAVHAPAGGADVSPAAAPVQRLGGGGGGSPAAGSDPIAAKIQAVAAAYRATTPHPTTASGETAFGRAVVDLWQACDTGVPAHDPLTTYLASPVEDGLKRETIGRLAARRGRLEFLLGWLLQGGIRSNGTDWENGSGSNATLGTDGNPTDSSSNSGTIVSRYTSSERHYGLPNQDWCGMFVGFCLAHAGMSEHVPAGHHTDHSELASAPRAQAWIEDSSREHGTGEVILYPSDLDAGQLPKPGDVVVFVDHVSMIEDATADAIRTVDGNVGLHPGSMSASVSGFAYTLADFKAAHGGLVLVWRPGLEAFGATSTAAGDASTDNTAGEALVTQIETVCNQVIALYQQLGLAGSVGQGQAVATMAAAS